MHAPEQLDLPDLEGVATFLQVAARESFTAAAAHLGVPKSTVSRRVTRLEQALGVRLVQRTTRRLSLTDEGIAFRDRATVALTALAEAASSAREQSATPKGHVRITVPADLDVLTDVVAEYSCAYPEVTIEVLLTDRRVDLVAEGFDLAVRASSQQLPDSSLVAKRVLSSGIGLFASREYLERRGTPKKPEDLHDHDCVLLHALHGRGGLRLTDSEGRAHALDLRAKVGANDFRFIERCVRAGIGIAPLPLPGSRRDGDDVLVRVLPRFSLPGSAIHIVYPEARLVSAKVRALRDLLEARLKDAFEDPPPRAPRKRRA